MKKVILPLILCALYSGLLAQPDCKVLLSRISDSYDGKCKDGLAHGKGVAKGIDTYEGQFVRGVPDGKGTYTWENGDTYTGQWEQGMRQGEGTFHYRMEGRDSVLAGMWEQDRYMGPKLLPPRVFQITGVDRYSFNKTLGIQNRVLVDIYQNGVRNRGLESFMINATSGTPVQLGESLGYENIIFPVEMKVSYITWNKLRTVRVNVIFEFEIYEPGDWVVDIHN